MVRTMDQKKHDNICKAYWALQDRIQSDPEYARLRSRLEALEGPYEALLSQLPPSEQQLLDQYITLRESLNRRLLEFACAKIISCRAGGTALAEQLR